MRSGSSHFLLTLSDVVQILREGLLFGKEVCGELWSPRQIKILNLRMHTKQSNGMYLLVGYSFSVQRNMSSPMIEYREAKKNYPITSKSTARNADGKENDRVENLNTKHALRPTFDPLVVEKLKKKEINCRPMTVQLLPDYNTAKAMYRASKSRAAAREGTTTEGGRTARIPSKPNFIDPGVSERSTDLASAPRRTASISSKPNIRDVSTDPATSDRSTDLASAPPTVESGLQALGLLRPIDNKTYEFGLASGEK